MVLSFSRMLFLRPVLTMDEASWVECHVAAFEFFGGAVARVVPDNLKTGVVKPDLYDPKINKAFGEFADYYRCLIDPARVLEASGQGSRRKTGALCPGFLLCRTVGRVHHLGRHADRRRALEQGRGQPAPVPGP